MDRRHVVFELQVRKAPPEILARPKTRMNADKVAGIRAHRKELKGPIQTVIRRARIFRQSIVRPIANGIRVGKCRILDPGALYHTLGPADRYVDVEKSQAQGSGDSPYALTEHHQAGEPWIRISHFEAHILGVCVEQVPVLGLTPAAL